jgi:hypothetical protein
MALKFFALTKEMIEAAGFDPKAVSPKLFLPILQNASIEENETLQSKWAALLANAAKGDDEETVHVGFIEVLKQLSPQDTLFLGNLYLGGKEGRNLGDMQNMTIRGIGAFPENQIELERLNTMLLSDKEKAKRDLTIDNLLRLRLIETNTQGDGPYASAFQGAKQGYWFTTFGLMFLKACTPPQAEKRNG